MVSELAGVAASALDPPSTGGRRCKRDAERADRTESSNGLSHLHRGFAGERASQRPTFDSSYEAYMFCSLAR